ncbi:MAG: hypothetical protein IKG14_01200 [Clostridia bacterium]|nr:hypothetical protein [Clostridia bacterium]
MKRKLIVSVIISIILILYSFTCFANNEVIGGVSGEAINGTTNIVKDTADGVGKATESVANGVSNIAGNIGNGVQEGAKTTGNFVSNITDNSMSSSSNEYNIASTNANSPNTFLGMDSMTWWWLIIGAICALVVVLLWHKMSEKSSDEEQ